jgi:hypothetical protein
MQELHETDKLGFVAYLDILGTSDKMEKESNESGKGKNQSLEDGYNDFRNLIRRWFPYERWENKLGVFGFSDSFFVTLEVITDNGTSIIENDKKKVNELFESLREFQLESLGMRKSVRGGIAFGNFIIDDPPSKDRIHMILGKIVAGVVKLEESMKMVGIALIPAFALPRKYIPLYQNIITDLLGLGLLIPFSVPCDFGLVPTHIVSW